MKKTIFQMEVVIDTEEKSVQTHLHMDKEDFELDVISMFKDIASSLSQAIAMGYTKKVLSFTDKKESEVKV